MPSAQLVTAKYPNQLWHVDLTVVPGGAGFWTVWLPFALPQCWPFCRWLAVVLDHYWQRVLDMAIFKVQPISEQLRQFLGRLVGSVASAPKHLFTDQGEQFTANGFQCWCQGHGIRQRFGVVGQRGSIAVFERFIGTLQREGTRALAVVPLLCRSF